MQTNLRLRIEFLGLTVYLIYLLIITMRPFELSGSSNMQYNLIENLSILDLVLNILLFIPFGFFVFRIIKSASWKNYIKVLICGVIGAVLSFIVETYQLFLLRDSELSDVLTNTAGAFIGAVLAKFYYKKVFRAIKRSWLIIQKSKRSLVLITVLYSAILFILFVFPVRYIDLRNWNPSFSFQMGNEATLNRPWVGKIYLVAIYNRALSDEEVYTNFKVGPYSGNDIRVKNGLVAFYNFREGHGKTVHDTSGFDPPLNLTVYDSSKIRWLTPGGLEILGGTIIRSQGSARKLYSAIKPVNEFSIEAWAAPETTAQKGPARIVSFSESTNLRNFTLGQAYEDISFRVRTPLSGLNGSDVNLITSDGFFSTDVRHLVATYEGGVETLFVDGVEHSRLALFDNIKLLDFFGNNILSKMAFCFFFFFPLSFLSYFLFVDHSGKATKPIVFSVLLNFGLLLITEIFYISLFSNKDFDFTLSFLVILVGIFTALICRALAESRIFKL